MDSLEEVIRKSMKLYYKGVVPEATYKAQEGRPKYTYKYFSAIEREYFNKETNWDNIKDGSYNVEDKKTSSKPKSKSSSSGFAKNKKEKK